MPYGRTRSVGRSGSVMVGLKSGSEMVVDVEVCIRKVLFDLVKGFEEVVFPLL